MVPRLRSIVLKTPALVVMGLLATYLVFGWFAFDPLVRWAAPKFVADKSGHRLTIAEARFDPLALSVQVRGLNLARPDGQPLLAFDELFVDFDAASLFRWAYSFDALRLTAPRARVELLPDGRLNWSDLIEAFKSDEEEPDKPLPRLLVREIRLERGKVELADRKAGFETALNPLDLSLAQVSTLPDDRGNHTLAATTQWGARIRWKGQFGLNPIAAQGDLAVDQVALERLAPYLKGLVRMAPPRGQAALGLSYQVGWKDKTLSLRLDKMGLELKDLALRGEGATQDALHLDRFALSDARFDLAQRHLEVGAVSLNGIQVNLRRGRDGRLDVMDWLPPAPKAVPTPAVPEKSSFPRKREPSEIKRLDSRIRGNDGLFQLHLGRFNLDGLSLKLRDETFAQPLSVEVGNVKLGFSARAEAGGAAPQAQVVGLGLEVSGLRLASGAQSEPLFVLGGLALREGRVDLAAREARIGKVQFSNGKAEILRDAQGGLPLLAAFRPAQPSPAATPAKATPPRQAESGWRYRVDQVDLGGFQLGLRDVSTQPTLGLDLVDIQAQAKGLSQNLNAPLPVRLGFRVAQGGQFQAEGKVTPAKHAADLQLKLTDLALNPAQPLIARHANLTLDGGRASLGGRLRYDGAPRFEGGFQIDDLLLKEADGGARFLAWKRLATDSLHASAEEVVLEELRLDGLGAKLVIDKDKTINLKKIMKTAPASPPAAEAKPAAPPVEAAPAQPFLFAIERIRVEDGELDFADHSLALPFGARIHHFKGAFNGIATRPGAHAQLELDGQVDDYGLARAAGQLDLFNATDFMDIKVVFRNVEMTNLTPYTATFAGRRIASGKLSLDLEYKIKQRQLLGENQIVMDKLELGEKVQMPGAKDLPLDLALAILKDSDGRIDLGLPVSGSLDDPQFSYGGIIWKAIGNIIGKIVTAPFRALGALFGGGGEKLEKLAFEAGEAGLTPPEKEKVKQIATILAKRPGLALAIHGAHNPEIDRPVLRDRQLRRALAEKMGQKLGPEEDPGPMSTANPKVRTALEALYTARFGEAEWKGLEERWRKANPDKVPQTGAGKMMSRLTGLFKKDEPLSADDLARLKDADLHALLQARLLEKESVSEESLRQLAQRRAGAVRETLLALGAPAERVRVESIEVASGEGREIPARMELGVAKKP